MNCFYHNKISFGDMRKIEKEDYIALGFFDGVHLGHKALLLSCAVKAKNDGAKSTAIIFEPHPRKIIYQLNEYSLLTPLREKIKHINKTGINNVHIINFTEEFKKLSPQEFFQEYILNQFKVGAIFVGYNYHFGFKRCGNINLIQQISREYLFKVHILKPVLFQNTIPISSTLIKNYLKEGNIEGANQLLGYPYHLEGIVLQGSKRGSKILSCPTANIYIQKEKYLPEKGVYTGFVKISKKYYQSLISIGVKPTFLSHDDGRTVEIHILHFSKMIYNKTIRVYLLKKIRDEKRFPNHQSLAKQIKEDRNSAERFFNEFHCNPTNLD